MGDGDESGKTTKTVSIDPSTLVVGGSRGSRRSNSMSGKVDRTRRTTISRRSRSEAKAEIEAKSAAVQEAVMKALTTQSALPPPPHAQSASPSTLPSSVDATNYPSSAGSTHTVSFNSGAAVKESATPNPHSVNAVQNALNDLNRLIEDRARERARKTIRAEHRRRDSTYALASATPISELLSFNELPSSRNVTPLEPNSTAASDHRHSPPWGCLKGGNLPTYREHMRTQRARRKQHQHTSASNANISSIDSTPRVRIQTPKETAAVSRSHGPDSNGEACLDHIANATHSSTPLADTVITVGRKENGRVAFVVGGQETRRIDRNTRGQRSVTSRAKLRKARLLRGGNNTPQRLVDVIAESVEIIGDVVRPKDNSISIQA